MGETTNIQWCHKTFNPWIGCTKVAPGCANCYAEADMDKRRHFAQWGPHGTRVKTTESNWRKPLKWDREAEAAGVRRRVFCASLADIFEDWQGAITNHERQQLYVSDKEPGRYPAVPFAGLESLSQPERDNIANGNYRPATMNDLRRDLFQMIDQTPSLDWLILTKRPENVKRLWPSRADFEYIPEAGALNEFSEFHRDNVWLGTSVSDQATADDAIPRLLECARLADVLFASAEPLLGPIDLTCLQHQQLYEVNALSGANGINRPLQGTGPKLDWVIAGGESVGGRPCHVEWILSIVEQCQANETPCFVKQMGSMPCVDYYTEDDDLREKCIAWEGRVFEPVRGGYTEWNWKTDKYQPPPGTLLELPLKDPKGGDMTEWLERLRVRQFPKATVPA